MPGKGIFNVPDLTKLSPSALVNCRLLIRDVSQDGLGHVQLILSLVWRV